MTNIYAALEIGTTRTVLAIGEAKSGDRLRLVCHAEIPSTGVRKSQILDITQATQSIKSVLREVERKQSKKGDSLTIGNAFLVVSGMHIKADPYSGIASVSGSKVTDDDIDEVVRSSRLLSLGRDRELLDVVDLNYTLDDLVGISSPKGMSGRVLKLNTLHIHADKNRIDNARTAANAAHLELRDPLFAATCAADAVLNGSDKKMGTLVIDLGGGSTGYSIHTDGYLAAVNSFGVGGDHITNDIAYAFQLAQQQAETLKRKEGSAIVRSESESSARVKMPGSSPLTTSRTISRRALDTVINLRCKEIFSIIRNDIEDKGLTHQLNGGVVLTGGGTELRGIVELAQREFALTVRIGKPTEIAGLEDEIAPQSFAAIAGALIYAHKNYEKKPFLANIIKGFFK